MRLYTCVFKDADLPGPIKTHSCGKAIRALDKAGHKYELETVKGGRLLPWTLKGNRDEIERLSGQRLVPILVLDDETVISGSKEIVNWAKQNASITASGR